MKKAGIFLDVSNLYYCLQKKYNRKLDYTKYLAYISELYEPSHIFAYVALKGNQNIGFIHALEKLGMNIRSKAVKEFTDGQRKCDLDVEIVLDMVNTAPKMDICVLGTADGDLAPAVSWLSARSIDTVILGCGVSADLKTAAKSVIEIPHSLLEC